MIYFDITSLPELLLLCNIFVLAIDKDFMCLGDISNAFKWDHNMYSLQSIDWLYMSGLYIGSRFWQLLYYFIASHCRTTAPSLKAMLTYE